MSTETDPKDMSYIIDNRTHFEVRVARLDIRISFHATRSVTREQALAEAIAYRDGLYQRYDLPSRESGKANVRVFSRKGKRNISGISLEVDKRSSKQHAYFVCKYKAGEEWERARFNIEKLGYHKAWEKALELRLAHHPVGSIGVSFEPPEASPEDWAAIRQIAPDLA